MKPEKRNWLIIGVLCAFLLPMFSIALPQLKDSIPAGVISLLYVVTLIFVLSEWGTVYASHVRLKTVDEETSVMNVAGGVFYIYAVIGIAAHLVFWYSLYHGDFQYLSSGLFSLLCMYIPKYGILMMGREWFYYRGNIYEVRAVARLQVDGSLLRVYFRDGSKMEMNCPWYKDEIVEILHKSTLPKKKLG